MENWDFTSGAKTIDFRQEIFYDRSIREFNYNFQRMEQSEICGAVSTSIK